MLKQRLILEQFVVEVHGVHLQVPELILDGKRLNVLGVIVVFEPLIRIKWIVENRFQLILLKTNHVTVKVLQ